jgi:hypothetical protein
MLVCSCFQQDADMSLYLSNHAYTCNNLHLIYNDMHLLQVVDVRRAANRDGKLNTWITVQYALPEVRAPAAVFL